MSKKPRKSRARQFEPTDEMRRQVETLSGFGMTHDEIRCLVMNPATGRRITEETLVNHFRAELDNGVAKADAQALDSLFRHVTGRAAQYDSAGRLLREELKPSLGAAIFWVKVRRRWRERVDVNMTNEPSLDLSKLTAKELDDYECLVRKAAPTDVLDAADAQGAAQPAADPGGTSPTRH